MSTVGRRRLIRHRIALLTREGTWRFFLRSMIPETLEMVSHTEIDAARAVPDYAGEFRDKGFFWDRGFVVIDEADYPEESSEQADQRKRNESTRLSDE